MKDYRKRSPRWSRAIGNRGERHTGVGRRELVAVFMGSVLEAGRYS